MDLPQSAFNKRSMDLRRNSHGLYMDLPLSAFNKRSMDYLWIGMPIRIPRPRNSHKLEKQRQNHNQIMSRYQWLSLGCPVL